MRRNRSLALLSSKSSDARVSRIDALRPMVAIASKAHKASERARFSTVRNSLGSKYDTPGPAPHLLSRSAQYDSRAFALAFLLFASAVASSMVRACGNLLAPPENMAAYART